MIICNTTSDRPADCSCCSVEYVPQIRQCQSDTWVSQKL